MDGGSATGKYQLTLKPIKTSHAIEMVHIQNMDNLVDISG